MYVYVCICMYIYITYVHHTNMYRKPKKDGKAESLKNRVINYCSIFLGGFQKIYFFPQVSRVRNPGELMIVIMDHHHQRGIQN